MSDSLVTRLSQRYTSSSAVKEGIMAVSLFILVLFILIGFVQFYLGEDTVWGEEDAEGGGIITFILIVAIPISVVIWVGIRAIIYKFENTLYRVDKELSVLEHLKVKRYIQEKIRKERGESYGDSLFMSFQIADSIEAAYKEEGQTDYFQNLKSDYENQSSLGPAHFEEHEQLLKKLETLDSDASFKLEAATDNEVQNLLRLGRESRHELREIIWKLLKFYNEGRSISPADVEVLWDIAEEPDSNLSDI